MFSIIAFIWAGVIALAVLIYVMLDGFDLGIALLFPFFRTQHDRDVMMTSVAPVWDGNETWLVMGGGGLLAVFPLAYSIILPALYAPIIAMLLGLVFRGVAFEFRWRTVRGKFLWDYAFAIGSFVATVAQGLALGTLVQGIKVTGRAYSGGWWDWLTPFSLLTALALLSGYALLGSTWLVMKTEGPLQTRMRRFALRSAFATLALIGVVSIWTPFLNPLFLQRWFAFPAIIYTLPVPILVAACAYWLIKSLIGTREVVPFLAAQGLFILSFVGLGISFYPYMVPTSVTIWDAATPTNSMVFLLAGAAVLVPLVLAYTAYSYWVFRGKVDMSAGYH
ncbi:MAG: cytochrome d ubiquinol oxidase subunit II [Hyphomicrobiales bacterium]|nr:cytochrome d ubiquinol oxidase subunit II [Hyphomicrobiales bacterium]MDE2115211.1 cytochrome d ubiquinol oxidase subunit II [Hyphomicrobiales bacterium]